MHEVSTGRSEMPKKSDLSATERTQLVLRLLSKEEPAVHGARRRPGPEAVTLVGTNEMPVDESPPTHFSPDVGSRQGTHEILRERYRLPRRRGFVSIAITWACTSTIRMDSTRGRMLSDQCRILGLIMNHR